MADTASTWQCCASCEKFPPEVTLKLCAKCLTTPYCSRDCQCAHWMSHKKICEKGGAPSTGSASSDGVKLSPLRGLDYHVAKPFTRLDKGTWLHGRPETDVYRLLIDAYRLRMDDGLVFDGHAPVDSIYGGDPRGLGSLQRFLDMAAKQPGLLPPWWDADKRKACEAMGMDHQPGNFHDLARAIKKADVSKHYEDPQFPMQLRMFAEAVYKRGPGGMDGTVRKMMVDMENADGPRFMTVLDKSQCFARPLWYPRLCTA